jgi:exonuclease III
MRIVLWNVRGLVSDKEKWKIVIRYLKSVADVIFLTETHCGPATVSKYENELKYQGIQSLWTTYQSPTGENSRGVAVLSLSAGIVLENHEIDPEGRWIDFSIKYNDLQLRSILLYAPCSGLESRRVFFEEISQRTQRLELIDQYDIMAGDFNNVLSPEDSQGFNGPGMHFASVLQEILNDSSLQDAWLLKDWAGNREETRNKRPSSWFTYKTLNSNPPKWRRLDRIYISKEHIWNIKHMSVLPCPTREYNEMDQPGGARQKSWNWDHSPVLCTLDPSANTTPKGPGYRRMNPTMFTRNDVREDLKNILLTAKQLELKWHEFKDILFEYLHEMQVMNKWLDRVDIAWNKLLLVRDSEGISDETLKIYTNRWLNALEKDAEMKKALGDRRRDLFLELPSRYLSKILKSRAADRTVKEIKDKQGQIHTDTAGILKSFQEYYTELYAEKPIIEASLHRLLTAWPAEPAAMQDIPNLFTKEELVKLIKDSDGFKSPGLDGAPYGLYQLEPDLFADACNTQNSIYILENAF